MDCHAAFAMCVLAPKSPLVKTSKDTPLSSFVTLVLIGKLGFTEGG